MNPIANEKELLEKIEALVDSATVKDVLMLLSQVCAEKALHIRREWQDVDTAFPWEIASDQVYDASRRVSI